jgi:excisionase family DNA binding protein
VPHVTDHAPQCGITPKEAARFLRISHNKVRLLIRAGQLGAMNTGTAAGPRYVILPQHIAAYVEAHAAVPPRPAKHRRRPAGQVDYYPDGPLTRSPYSTGADG